MVSRAIVHAPPAAGGCSMPSFLEGVFRVLQWATITVIFVDVLILLPLAAFRRTRTAAGVGLFGSSWLFGLNLWLASAFFTFMYWGWPALIVGLLFIGLGVLPIAVAALLWHSDWSGLGGLTEWVAL